MRQAEKIGTSCPLKIGTQGAYTHTHTHHAIAMLHVGDGSKVCLLILGQVSMYGRGVMYKYRVACEITWLRLCVHAVHICVVRHNRMHEVTVYILTHETMGFNTEKLLYFTSYLFFTFNRSDALALP